MATNDDPRVTSFPIDKKFQAEARARRIRELRAQVRSGTYRLDAEAVALALLETGAIEAPHAESLDTSPEALRQARARFVIPPAAGTEGDQRSAAV